MHTEHGLLGHNIVIYAPTHEAAATSWPLAAAMAARTAAASSNSGPSMFGTSGLAFAIMPRPPAVGLCTLWPKGGERKGEAGAAGADSRYRPTTRAYTQKDKGFFRQ